MARDPAGGLGKVSLAETLAVSWGMEGKVASTRLLYRGLRSRREIPQVKTGNLNAVSSHCQWTSGTLTLNSASGMTRRNMMLFTKMERKLWLQEQELGMYQTLNADTF